MQMTLLRAVTLCLHRGAFAQFYFGGPGAIGSSTARSWLLFVVSCVCHIAMQFALVPLLQKWHVCLKFRHHHTANRHQRTTDKNRRAVCIFRAHLFARQVARALRGASKVQRTIHRTFGFDTRNTQTQRVNKGVHCGVRVWQKNLYPSATARIKTLLYRPGMFGTFLGGNGGEDYNIQLSTNFRELARVDWKFIQHITQRAYSGGGSLIR